MSPDPSPTKGVGALTTNDVECAGTLAHLAIMFCRRMNIPAVLHRLSGDIGVPADPAPMDFSAWFEAYLGDRWDTFDAQHNIPRIGRILMARGETRDELLNSEIFYSLREARIIIGSWRCHYNAVRLHASLKYKPPAPEALMPTFAAWPASLGRSASPATLAIPKALN